MNPANGKMAHGLLLRQLLVRELKASGRTWTKPVASMTPAAKHLMTKKASLSGLRALNPFPITGKQTPMALVARIVNNAAILHLSDRSLLKHKPSSLVHDIVYACLLCLFSLKTGRSSLPP